MNTIRELKQQEKYDNMLKRKNKEKNIYKSKNSTLRIEKMNLIKAVERKNKEIERLKKELEDTKEHLGEYLHEQEEENKRLNNIINELEKWLNEKIWLNKIDKEYINGMTFVGVNLQMYQMFLDKLQELKGVDKE